MASEYVIDVRPFDMGTDKEAALKPLEEAAEAFGAWQEYKAEGTAYARKSVIYECCDVIQATANLLHYIGADNDEVAYMMRNVTESNRSRGRYGSDGEGQDQARKNQGA